MEASELTGKVLTVERVRTVNTGTYYGPSGGSDYDYEPGGLDDRKTHRLAKVYAGLGPVNGFTNMRPGREIEIPTGHLEKL